MSGEEVDGRLFRKSKAQTGILEIKMESTKRLYFVRTGGARRKTTFGF